MNFFHNIEHNFTHFNSPAHIFNIAPPPIFKPLQPPPHTIPPFNPPFTMPPFHALPPPHIIQLQPKEQHTEQPSQQPPQVAPVAVVDNTTKPTTQSTFSNFFDNDSSYILYGIAGLGIIIYVFNKN